MVDMRIHRIFALSACALQLSVAQHVGVPTNDLDKVSLDELFSVQVTSVGRKAQKLSKAPAAVFVFDSRGHSAFGRHLHVHSFLPVSLHLP